MSSGAKKIRDNLAKAIRACIDNAQRLQAETYDLEFRTPSATRYFLLIIAQEEAAKAFVLYLIKERIVPLTSAVRRAINDHACKHLVGMIMEYMIMHWEGMDELKAIIDRDFELGNNLPSDVGSALEILRYEKIGRWTANNWVWAEDPAYDREAVKVADGNATAVSKTLYMFGSAPPGNWRQRLESSPIWRSRPSSNGPAAISTSRKPLRRQKSDTGSTRSASPK